jgi:hypothetical protein
MDQLGKAMKDFIRQVRSDRVRNALALTGELSKEGMNNEQIEEMLFASGFEDDVVAEAMDSLPARRHK